MERGRKRKMNCITLFKAPDIAIPIDTKDIFAKKHKKIPNGSTLPKMHLESIANTTLYKHRV